VAKVKKDIVINAPPAKIFGFIGQPTNLPEFWPSLLEVRDVEQLPDGRYRYNWTYKMAGMRFEGDTEFAETVPNQRIVSENGGGIKSTIAWIVQPEGAGTRVTFDAEYTVPIPLLGKLAEAIIVRQNDREAEVLLKNLKDRMEA
jgi:uncharacterized protein YndB with AHSA1/START domain